MEDNQTRPITASSTQESVQETQVSTSPEASQNGPSRRKRVLYVLLVYIAALFVVGLFAYFQGRRTNTLLNQEQLDQALREQYELGQQDLESGRYAIARQRFEAVIQYDPEYPGAEDGLVEALLNLEVPTLTPTPQATATPDPSPPEQLLADAKAAINSGDWDTVVNKLLALRGKDPEYEKVKVDGYLYIALRNIGMDLIAQGEMEEGLYHLSLAEQFGPLDRDALFRRTLAQQYLLANSFIGLNWARAAELFAGLCEQGATTDSCPKFADAAWKYGDQLWDAGDICAADDQYEASLDAYPFPELEPTADKADDECEKLRATPTPPPATPTPTFTPTPDGGGNGNGGGNGSNGGDGDG
jgi:tetratricopeptide (TPR) repeat protein